MYTIPVRDEMKKWKAEKLHPGKAESGFGEIFYIRGLVNCY
jgi:hypothetical protein